MSLFNQILSAINNPQQEATNSQLGGILNTVQQLVGNYQSNSTAVQSAVSIVGNYTRSALQKKRESEEEQGVETIINQFAGTQANQQIVQALFTTPQIQQIVREIEAKTGMGSSQVQAMLPMLVPIVLNFLKTGTNTNGSNPVLNSFLDADNDGDVDLADVMQMTNRYLGRF